MILIYAETITPRITYIFNHFSKTYLGFEATFTSSLSEFKQSYQPRINYSSQIVENVLSLKIDSLLFEDTINEYVNYESLHEIGKCFFWLTRYEEYISNKECFDHHNRFIGSQLDYNQPIVDVLFLQIRDQLKAFYPDLKLQNRSFQQINSHDVDYAWKYCNQGLFKSSLKFIKNIFKGDFNELQTQFKVLFNKGKDPFDEYDYIKQKTIGYQIKTVFFWQLGDYGEFDKNLSWKNQAQKKLIKDVSSWAEIGIHPSYQSNENFSLLKEEVRRLDVILGKKVKSSRQHYIKLSIPDTYQQLLKCGIENDYSMGFASKIGFRAGTCTAFKWFDLTTNQQTLLTIFPFVVMDTTLKNYLKISPEEAIEKIKKLKEEVKTVDGMFITIFHPSNFNGNWIEWKKVYESIFL